MPIPEDDHSIVAHLLRLRDPQGRPLSKERLVQEFFIFFLAGAETTGCMRLPGIVSAQHVLGVCPGWMSCSVLGNPCPSPWDAELPMALISLPPLR